MATSDKKVVNNENEGQQDQDHFNDRDHIGRDGNAQFAEYPDDEIDQGDGYA
jgi:hypothetical protein